MAIEIGMTKHEFLHSTPKDIKLRFKAYGDRKKEEFKHDQYVSWMTGLYVKCAIGSAFSKHGKYPENPLQSTDIRDIAEKTGKTEEELNGEKVMMSMLVMEANAKIAEVVESVKSTAESDL